MSLFGELQFGHSRAVSDDEDDEYSQLEQDQNLKKKIYWLENIENKVEVDELILADGPIPCAFLYVYLLNHLGDSDKRLLGLTATNSEFKVYQNEDKTDSSLNKLRKNFIYQVTLNGKSYLICEIFTQLKSNEFYDWLDQLWEKFEFKSSIILSSQNKTSYFSSDSESFPCVKFLSSNKNFKNTEIHCKRLEEPNFLQDLPAALIQFCMLKKLEFTAFVCYSPSLNIDIQSVKETFNGVSCLLKDNSIFTDNDLSKKTLLTVGNLVNSVSSLYM
ncbi:unnamed protein product [Brachionus calyciflorus]|uniref:Proteasome assembly chaperone 1 n=1 Tax=Brachionus calyciflorus TaxID=104777 RepID=A0A813VJ46_9BILA|nr:unnamed protein product [Brachionus calyciflorus]